MFHRKKILNNGNAGFPPVNKSGNFYISGNLIVLILGQIKCVQSEVEYVLPTHV